jgi:hypothetical protein
MPAELPNPDELVSSEDITGQVSRILVSPTFTKSERMRTLLEYLVEQSLRGTPEKLKEYAIGVDVFKRGFVAKFWKEATQASISRLSVSLG